MLTFLVAASSTTYWREMPQQEKSVYIYSPKTYRLTHNE